MNTLRPARAPFVLALLLSAGVFWTTPLVAQEDFIEVPPCRVVETRDLLPGGGRNSDTSTGTPLLAGTPQDFQVAGACGIPSDANGVMVMLAAVNSTDQGNIVIYEDGIAETPAASNVNFPAGENRAGNTNVALSASGKIAALARLNGTGGKVHFILDVMGYFVTSPPPSLNLDTDDSGGASPDFAATFTEDAGPVPITDDVTVADPDDPQLQKVTVTLTNLLDAGQETLAANAGATGIIVSYNGATGELLLTGPASLADFATVLEMVTYNNTEPEPDPTARVITFVADGINDSPAVTTTVDMSAQNDAPTDIALSDTTVADGALANTLVGTFSTTDNDAGDSHTYTLVGGTGSDDNTSFTISGNELRTVGAVDFETKSSYKIRVRSTDAGGLFVEKEFTITVDDENEQPTDLSLSPTSIAENQTPPAVVGTFSTSDPDPGDSHTYTLVSGIGSDDNTSFDIVGNQLRALASFDRETKSSYNIRVRTTDAGGLFYEEPLTITVDNANEDPTNLALSNATVAENELANTLVGTLTTTDPDTPDSHTYTFAAGGADNASFTIAGGNELRTAAPLDFEARPSGIYNIRIRTTDAGGLFFEKDLAITTTNVNEDPTDLALSNATLAENQAANTLVGTFTTTDQDNPDSHTYTFAAGGADNGSFTIVSGNELRTAAPLDFESRPSGVYNIRIRTTDAGGLFFEKDVAITTTNANEDPTNIVLSPSTVAENQAVNTLVGTLSTTDPDTPDSHTYMFAAGGPDNGSFTISGSQIRTAAMFNFEADNSYTIRVRTTDAGGLFFEKDLTISISNENETPTDIALSGTSVNENSPAGTLVGNLSTADQDSPDTHSYTLVAGSGSTNNNFFQIVSGQLQLALSPNYEVNQSLSVRVRTTDAGGLFYEEAFTIAVLDLNEPPTPVLDTYTSFGNTQLASGGVAGTHRAFSTDPDQVDANDIDPDTNPAFNSLSVLAVSDQPTTKGGTYTLFTDGSFTYQPPVGYVTTTSNPADPTGPDTFFYTLTDGANNVPGGEVRITVNHRIWYVHNNPGTAGNAGDSRDPVDTLSEAETKSGPNDYIYVFEGDGTNTGMSAGITLKDGQKLLGEAWDLVVAGTKLVEVAEGVKRPEISDANDTVTVLANTANGNRTGIEIRGLQLSSTGGSPIDLESANASNLEATVEDIVITGSGASQEGINVTAGSTGTTTIAIHDNNITAAASAIDIQKTAAGTVYITKLHDNIVPGTSAAGITVGSVGTPIIFDATPGSTIQAVRGGGTMIGTAVDRISGPGLVLNNVTGELTFANPASVPEGINTGDLDIYTDTGAALDVTGGAGGFTFQVTPNAGVLVANFGPAAVISGTSLNLQLNALTSSTSSSGVSLTNVSGTFSAPSGSSITKASGGGAAFSVDNSAAGTTVLSSTYAGLINNSSSTGRSVSINNADSGSALSFTGQVTDSPGQGVTLTTNTGATISFSGGLTLSTGGNTGFNATGGGTVTVTDPAGLANNTITTAGGTALNVASTTIGASGLTFERISAGSGGTPANGIVLSNTGSGALTVTGTGSAGSGGTINSATGAGISLTNTGAINLSYMNVQNGGDDGLRGSGVNGLNLTTLNVSSNGNAVGEHGIEVAGLTGSGGMANCTVTGSAEHNVSIANTSGTLSAFNVTNSSFTSTNMTTGGDGFLLENNGSGSMTVSITGSTFTDNKGDHFQAATFASTTGSINLTFSNNTLTTTAANDPNVVGGGITISPTGSADVTFTINNNNIQQAFDEAININLGGASTASSSLIGTISSNTIGTAGDADSGSESGSGITVASNGAGLVTVAVTNNQVRQYANPYGISLAIRDGSTSMNATVTGNTVANPGSFAINGIRVDAGATAGDSGTLCAAVTGNSVAGSGPAADTDIRLRQRFNTTIRLPGYGGSNSDTTAVNSFVAGNNAGSDVSSAHNVGGGGGGFVGGAACPTP